MTSAAQRRWVPVLFFLSGAPALGAQVAWTRVFSAGLGHEMPALMGVVTAFFLGLAAGAWVLDPVVSRSRRPLVWYAGLEAFSAGWILLTLPWLDALNRMARDLTGLEATALGQGLVALVVPWVAIGPSAAALGATFPAMDRVLAPQVRDGRAVAWVYALNTAGAMTGLLLFVGWLIPALGFRGSLGVAAGIQALCGAVAGGLAGVGRKPVVDMGPHPDGALDSPGAGVGAVGNGIVEGSSRVPGVFRGWAVGGMAMGTGFLGMGYEVLGIRALAQTTENTVRTFATALAVFLAGQALGAGLQRVWVRSGREPRPGAWMLGLSAVVALELAVAAWGASGVEMTRQVLGRWGSELVWVTGFFLVPTLGMGAVYATLGQWARRTGGGLGRFAAWNTLGGAGAGGIWMGLVLPWVGWKWAVLGVAMGYAMLGGWLAGWRRSGWGVGLAAGALGVSALLIPGGARIQDGPPGSSVVRHEEGRLASVTVLRTADGHRVLRVNRHFQQGGTATALAARRHAALPLLLHPGPRRALFLGLGTGLTFGAAAEHPGLEADGVELLPEVVRVLPEFAPENGNLERRPGFRVRVADARRWVQCSTNRYDVVVADLFHPAEDGAGFLYTREHFAGMRERLASGGLVCQWLPLHQMDLATVRVVARTFVEVFPGATLWLLRSNLEVPVVGLVGGTERWRVDPEALERRLADAAFGRAMGRVALNTPARVLGSLLAGPDSLARFAAGGDVATDDRPRVLFLAAATVYRGAEGPPSERLAALMKDLTPEFASVLPAGKAGSWVGRLEAYRTARDLHLRGLAREQGGDRRGAMEDYVASAGASAEYTAGYAQAVLVASAFAGEDRPWAVSVLRRLVLAQPGVRLAQEVLERLESAGADDAPRSGGTGPAAGDGVNRR